MKKLFLFLAICAFIAFAFSSCAATKSTKRDCQGNKHYKQKGGFYM